MYSISVRCPTQKEPEHICRNCRDVMAHVFTKIKDVSQMTFCTKYLKKCSQMLKGSLRRHLNKHLSYSKKKGSSQFDPVELHI